MNLIINTLTFGLIVLIQGYACAIDWSLISTDIPKNTGSIFLNRTEIVRGFKDYNYTEVQLVEKCRGQAENQRSVIRVLDGGHIKNLIVGVNAGNGIYCEGSCTLENVHWRAVCEVCFSYLNFFSNFMIFTSVIILTLRMQQQLARTNPQIAQSWESLAAQLIMQRIKHFNIMD